LGATAYLFITRDSDGTSGGNAGPYGPLLDASGSLLSVPREVDLLLSVDIPKGSESDNPDHQEITAEGNVDFGDRNAELVYDFDDLANAAGFMGHFDTLDVIYVDGTGYLDIFTNGPPWVSIQPRDASNGSVQRLRDLMMTTPVALPAMLEVAAEAELGPSGELSREVDASALAESGDEIAAGIGAALEELGGGPVVLEVTLDEDAPSEIVAAFGYNVPEGRIEVEVTYELALLEGDVSVTAPDDSDVREFSSFFN
jgi:hypothetical protein